MQPATPDPSLATLYVHVRILLGMIVGLGLTHLLRSFANLIEKPDRKPLYWIHVVWVVSVFLYLLHFWWWEFRLSHLVEWDFDLYLFVTLYALLLYLLCVFVLSDSTASFPSYRDYYFAKRNWFFGLLAVIYAVDLVDTWVKGGEYLNQFGIEYPIRNCAYIALSLVAIATRNPLFHGTFAVAGLAYQVSWIVRLYEFL